MTRVVFYAPMKSPNSPVPSGDRAMARNLMAAIGANGAPVELASELKIYDKHGDEAVQRELHGAANLEALRLVQTLPADTALWVSYHNYYKSPDLIGPKVCRARNIPYVQLESTRAQKRLTGPWSDFARAAHDACDAARIIFYHTEYDHFALSRDRFGSQDLVSLPPFLPYAGLPGKSDCSGPMLAAGMMRHGDKQRSYRLIADTLALLPGDWRLNIAGDGPARTEVEAMMAPFGERVRFLGQLDRTAMQAAYADAALMFWPGVNEAYGMVYLEAQAAGLPVVAQDRPGVRDVLLPGSYPSVEGGAIALARMLDTLLADTEQRRGTGIRARAHVADRHLMPAATQTFWTAVLPLLERRE